MKGWTHWNPVSSSFFFFKQIVQSAPFSLAGARMGTGGSHDPFLLQARKECYSYFVRLERGKKNHSYNFPSATSVSISSKQEPQIQSAYQGVNFLEGFFFFFNSPNPHPQTPTFRFHRYQEKYVLSACIQNVKNQAYILIKLNPHPIILFGNQFVDF